MVSNNLKFLRECLGFTGEEFAKMLGIVRVTYVNYEVGRNDAPVSVLKTLSDKTGISMDQLADPEFASKTNSDAVLKAICRQALLPE